MLPTSAHPMLAIQMFCIKGRKCTYLACITCHKHILTFKKYSFKTRLFGYVYNCFFSSSYSWICRLYFYLFTNLILTTFFSRSFFSVITSKHRTLLQGIIWISPFSGNVLFMYTFTLFISALFDYCIKILAKWTFICWQINFVLTFQCPSNCLDWFNTLPAIAGIILYWQY